MNWFYWWFTNLWYRIFYSDKMFNLVLKDSIFERGEFIKTSGKYFLTIVEKPIVENPKSTLGKNYRYKVIPQKYFITKQELLEGFGLFAFFVSLLLFIWFTFIL